MLSARDAATGLALADDPEFRRRLFWTATAHELCCLLDKKQVADVVHSGREQLDDECADEGASQDVV